MKKNIDLKSYLNKVQNFGLRLKPFVPITLIILVAAGYGLSVWHIKALSSKEPSEDAVSEQILAIKRPRIDPNAVKQIQDLQATNVQVQAAFQAARDNPFQDQ